jgi:hypothetical protein
VGPAHQRVKGKVEGVIGLLGHHCWAAGWASWVSWAQAVFRNSQPKMKV